MIGCANKDLDGSLWPLDKLIEYCRIVAVLPVIRHSCLSVDPKTSCLLMEPKNHQRSIKRHEVLGPSKEVLGGGK